MRRVSEMRWLALWAFLLWGLSLSSAYGWTSSHELVEGEVSILNEQANSSWVPVAVMIQFEVPTTSSMKIVRVSGGRSFTLGIREFENAVSVVWIPEAPYSFRKGDALVVMSDEPDGVIQLIRRGE